MAEIAAEIGLSAERVRQVVRRADGGARPARRPGGSGGGERVRLRIGNLAKAVLVTGQAYQDPKDALNEFVSNAADDYAEAGLTGRRIRILLRRQGTRAAIAVDDSGRGMDPDRLRAVARNLFESSKAGDDRTLGEKAIGLLAFQQLGGCCEIVSRANGSDETWTLRLRRGDTSADLVREKRRARATSGTTVFISDLDTEAARVLTQRKVVEYLRRRRGAAIAAGAYEIEVVEGRTGELVTPDEPAGLPIPLAGHDTLWGKLEFALYVAGDTDAARHVAVVGRAGTTIIDDIAELEEFDHEPWTSGQPLGPRVVRAAAPVGGTSGDPARRRHLSGVPRRRARPSSPPSRGPSSGSAATSTSPPRSASADALRQVFGRVLRELADLENPMRTLVGDDAGGDGDRCRRPPAVDRPATRPTEHAAVDRRPRPRDPVRLTTGADRPPGRWPRSSTAPAVHRARTPSPVTVAAGSTPTSGTVLYNEQHADFLLVKDDETALLDYLATLVAKEYVVYNNPRADADELAEELVRMLIRVRRHLPRRSRRRV